MAWLWGSSSTKKESSETTKSLDLEFADPSLKEFYASAKPPTPVSLAPSEDLVDNDIPTELQSIANTASLSETVSSTYSNLGAGTLELKGGGRKLSLQQAARDNCVEFEIALSNCIVKGSIWNRFLSCHTQHMNQQKCTELQEYALAVLGYNQALSQDQRRKIQDKADDLLIEYAPENRLTEDICDRFKTAVDDQRTANITYRS